jgi:hypothetical protein
MSIVRIAAGMYVMVDRGRRPGGVNELTSPRVLDLGSPSRGAS